ncbi:hypothetical protein V1514DRAFT_68619 [Lipomyces japonicus]|uniref:uncharacterized protein n=1 Tax=Lipomyces japonicus TaxID=56871 RepID=UPI0034CFE708
MATQATRGAAARYVGAAAAAAFVAADPAVAAHAGAVKVLPPDLEALATVNRFVDGAVFAVVAGARSSVAVSDLAAAVTRTLPQQLARLVAVDADQRDDERDKHEAELDNEFDPISAWTRVRIRCMNLSALGDYENDIDDMDDEDDAIDDYDDEPARVYLAGMVDHVAEYVLRSAGRAALSRVLMAAATRRSTASSSLAITMTDLGRLAMDPVLGKIWQHWRARDLTNVDHVIPVPWPSENDHSRLNGINGHVSDGDSESVIVLTAAPSQAVPGFSSRMPSDKVVRKYTWISHRTIKSNTSISTSASASTNNVNTTSNKTDSTNHSINDDDDDPDIGHVTFEHLLKSDVTYKLSLTPDKLRDVTVAISAHTKVSRRPRRRIGQPVRRATQDVYY